ncbi:ExeM/NucH family extracellular endonuclease [Marinicella sediminis]|uniref:ExeM/NucH family extracellular endonuclease n=1 Tax=Marinicella sediminis TaxID=1792834 RepID=A0ABV7J7L5_9GAMM|nr:ExeM/NucH family extracellular endonuclease [Marinicella sediminis]
MKIVLLLCSMWVFGTSWSESLTCDKSFVAIHDIQGTGQASKLVGERIHVSGIVTADFRGKQSLGGFFIQSVNSDDDIYTSEGLFIRDNDTYRKIKVGDLVAIDGYVSEEYELTQLDRVQKIKVCQSGLPLPSSTSLYMPKNDAYLEAHENMYVTLFNPVVITDVYQYIKYGELTVSSEMLMAPTAVVRGEQAVKEVARKNQLDQLIIDDGRLAAFATPLAKGFLGQRPVSAANRWWLGDQVQPRGVLFYAFGKYKLQPTEPLMKLNMTDQAWQQPKDVGGTVQVATFNVQNFFTTIDDGQVRCGPTKQFSCRGADSPEEYNRQVAKLVSAINTTNASVMGIQELENNQTSGGQLVQHLNEAAGHEKWAYIDTGALGEDVIKVGLIYQPGQLQTVGDYALLNAAANPAFKEHRNRIVVAQSFKSRKGNVFTVATAHFKSKSCSDAEGANKAQADGQGCYNPVRTEVAEQVANWLNSDPTGHGSEVLILVGDLNSYQQEDPIGMLSKKGMINLANPFLAPTNWTASYRGQVGSLDYIMTNDAGLNVVTELTQWHINSAEMPWFGYHTEALDKSFNKPDTFFQPDPFSSSDHDVVIAGFEL